MNSEQSPLSKLVKVFHKLTPQEWSENRLYCHVCLRQGNLTKEHVPPRAAYNTTPLWWDRVIYLPGSQKMDKAYHPGGFWVRTLCGDCNNRVCGPYAEEYVTLIKHLTKYHSIFDPHDAERRLISVPPVNTLQIAKEIATMILAVEPIFFARHVPELRQFVLSPRMKCVPPFKVFAFLVPDDPRAGTIAPAHARVDTFAPGLGMHGGEISRWPLGIVYSWELGRGYRPDLLEDITGWFWGERPPFLRMPTKMTVIDCFHCLLGYERKQPQSEFIY